VKCKGKSLDRHADFPDRGINRDPDPAISARQKEISGKDVSEGISGTEQADCGLL